MLFYAHCPGELPEAIFAHVKIISGPEASASVIKARNCLSQRYNKISVSMFSETYSSTFHREDLLNNPNISTSASEEHGEKVTFVEVHTCHLASIHEPMVCEMYTLQLEWPVLHMVNGRQRQLSKTMNFLCINNVDPFLKSDHSIGWINDKKCLDFMFLYCSTGGKIVTLTDEEHTGFGIITKIG